MNFQIKDDFYLDDHKIKIISGGMHYFRILPEYWKDRLEKLKALGCNTVETYIPWNLHEPEQGAYAFEGILDIAHFVKTAQEVGLYVILRPSPYICAEWEFGGLPYWLLKEDGMKLRCAYPPFLERVKTYYETLFKILVPLQITHGGAVILMQVENEYGYYGEDKAYLTFLKNLMISLGTDVPLVTSDGANAESFSCGEVEGVLQTANFGSATVEKFSFVKKKQKEKPLMCMEFWVGWFDSWGDEVHQTGDTKEHAKELDEILRQGHVNIYMFCGGTNFGFMNGSNYYDELTPDVTSYDYDALLSENGDITPKYEAFQNVIKKHTQLPEARIFEKANTKAYGTISLTRKTGLFENLQNISKCIENRYPQSMEKLDQGYGYTLYESNLKYETSIENIRLIKANDRAMIYFDDKKAATLYDRELLTTHEFIPSLEHKNKILILTENMGRVNFGAYLEEQRKGIDGDVIINGHKHFYWKQYPLDMKDLSKLDYTKPLQEGEPGFYEFAFEVTEATDSYLDMTQWGKGCVLINGFLLGRYWNIGPQKHLYIPAALFHTGENKITVFETEGITSDMIRLTDVPDLG